MMTVGYSVGFYLVKYSDAQVEEKRQKVLQMKQFLQDNKVCVFKRYSTLQAGVLWLSYVLADKYITSLHIQSIP